jgi:predicted Rdx family selenoprotein
MMDAIKADSGGDYGQGCAALIYKLHPDGGYYDPAYLSSRAKDLIRRMRVTIFSPHERRTY